MLRSVVHGAPFRFVALCVGLWALNAAVRSALHRRGCQRALVVLLPLDSELTSTTNNLMAREHLALPGQAAEPGHDPHVPARDQRAYYEGHTPGVFLAAYKFAFIRSPFAAVWQRFQSAFAPDVASADQRRAAFTKFVQDATSACDLLFGPDRPCSQRAWLTDTNDELLVDHVVRLEDMARLTTYTCSEGLHALLCGETMESASSRCSHPLAELRSADELSVKLAREELTMRHLYTNATCEMVATYFAADLALGGYSLSDCLTG